MAQKGKRLGKSYENFDRNAEYGVDKAIGIVKDNATAKFDESVEIAMNLGVDPRHADQMVRGVVALPHGTGRDVRVAVFARDAKAEEATAAGADIVGAEELMTEIQNGRMDFDRVIATPDMMAVVGRLGKVLGPRGLMPNPKTGTVTPDTAKAVSEIKGGKIEFRVDKHANVHFVVGKASFSAEQLDENLKAALDEIVRLKPSSSKGRYIQKASLSTTFGPGVPLDVSAL